MRDAINNIKWLVSVLGLAFACGYKRSFIETNNKNLLAWAYAWASGGGCILLCNVAIFLRKLVTCTTMWAYPLGNPCIKRGGCMYCICIPEVYTPIVLTKSRSVKIFLFYFYFLDYFYINHYYNGNKALIKPHATKYYINFKRVFGFIN